MFARPRSHSKGVTFGGPDLNSPANDDRPEKEADEPPAKKKKLSEPSTPSSAPSHSKSEKNTLHTTRYQYQLVAPIILGVQPEVSIESSLSPVQALVRPQSAPPTEEEPRNGQELIELTAEPIIHFKKQSLRDAAISARPYAPHSNPSAQSGAPSPAKSSEPLTLPPWALQKYDSGFAGLNQEIWDFFRYLQPTREERMLRLDLVERLKTVIRSRWPGADVRFFGSFATELLLPTSDIDLVVLNVPPIQSNLWIVRSLLQTHGFSNSANVVAHAKVPLVKFCDDTTGLEVDVSFDQPNGLKNTQVVNSFANKYTVFRPLLLTLKYLLHQLSANEPYSGGLGSYGLSLMLASFLQLHPKTNNVTGQTEDNLGNLFLDFLSLYGRRFNFYNIGISVRDEGSYFSKFERGWIDASQPFLASIEDPNDETNDVGRSCYRILTIRSYFNDAFAKLANLPQEISSTMLSRVIFPDPAIEHARSHLPGLVEHLSSTSPSFKKHVKPIIEAYDEKGVLKKGLSQTHLGDSQTLSIPESLRSSALPVVEHLMFGSDDDDDEADDYFTEHTSIGSDDDRLAPIVISSDDEWDDSASHAHAKGDRIISLQKNAKKRKR